MRRIAFLITLASMLPYASIAYAQASPFSGIGGAADLTISMSPQTPTPGAAINLTLEDSSGDLSQSTITWSANGATLAQGLGQTTANVVAPALGKDTDVTASVQNPDGSTDAAQITIAPTEVDLLADSDSYVPPFYRGRTLPGAETNIRVQAIAHFIRPDGTAVPSSEITYTWKQDDRVVGAVSGIGKSSAILPAALLFGSSQIEVDAASTDGTLSGSASLSIPTVDPVLVLYEDNPVYGFTYYRAIPGAISLPDIEMTFAAVPYFVQASGPNDPRLSYAWTVNGSSVGVNQNDPSELTLNASNSSGSASIALTLTDSQNPFVESNGAWTITLGASQSSAFETSSSGSSNPFTGTGN